jgi:hypothetical protein
MKIFGFPFLLLQEAAGLLDFWALLAKPARNKENRTEPAPGTADPALEHAAKQVAHGQYFLYLTWRFIKVRFAAKPAPRIPKRFLACSPLKAWLPL